MADYTYTGLTAYILPHTGDMEKLNLLADAIEGLKACVESVEFDKDAYENVVCSDGYLHIYSNESLCYPHESELPQGTPEEYARPSVEGVTIKDISFIKLNIPTVSKSSERIESFIYKSLRPVLLELFGNHIVSMKTKTAMEYENFRDGKETVLVSVKDRVKSHVAA
ncbi:MAG: hypothetical protein ABF649_18180 [Bacillus sp. (in: firmicutes)]